MREIWNKSIDIIKKNVTQQNFETWIQPLEIVSLQENNAYLSVPNKFFKDWLSENYTPVIKDALSSVTGFPVQVVFVVDKDSDGAHSHTTTQRERVEHSTKKQTPKKTLGLKVYTSLNLNYSFERFVVGPCNQFAHAACMAVAEQPAQTYNPLFIYGGVGLGKTHLLNAIGLQALKINPERHVLYVSAEEFMNELIGCIRYDKMPMFREKFRNIEYLLIDDIQFIAGKDRTQEEFFHTFNTLHDSGKQIVVTSDKFPKDIPNLEGRLRSRFEWGLVADIQPPEIETKMAILIKKAEENQLNLPNNVAYFIASKSESSIRELEGYLIRIAAYASLSGKEITMDLAKEILNDILKQGAPVEVSVDEIIKTVAGKFAIKINDLKSEKKNKNLVIPRQITMYLARKLTSDSFPDIGAKMGGKDHSTVIYANNKIKKLVDTDMKIKKIVEELEDILLKKG
ncbi:MAG TPA: chromosomal replication initiator protein DnaA [Syntrophales bacterium]|nr:chromosomal replication initiator protein DnaA [Syntrophales bacterium]HRT26994.1 chromosomal replication initiator protein DnaA [Syntrophales bacterium]HRT70472.1 chromosomal replication initiator protein DnaA [Syntrophales bacterium]